MAEMRNKLQLKKELTQIRKAARVLRDPGTTTSWKSPLNSSRSAAALASPSAYASAMNNGDKEDEKEKKKKKKVFLYNWKNQKSSSSDETTKNNDDDDLDEDLEEQEGGYSSILESVDDSLSDARNNHNGGGNSSSRVLFGCRDSNPVSLSATPTMKRVMEQGKRKSKKPTTTSSHFDSLSSRYNKQKQIVLAMNSNLRLGLLGLRDDSVSVEQTDDNDTVEDYYFGDSPLLLKKIKQQKRWSNSPSKLLLRRSIRKDKEDSSYSYSTPALSTSSYNRYVNNGSWDATSVSLVDDDVDDPLDLPGRQGCGIPCYWSRRSTPKHRGGGGGGLCRSCYSPSLSDTIRRKGSSILCGSQSQTTNRHGRRRRSSSSISNRRRMASWSAQGILPLLTNNGDRVVGSSLGTGNNTDDDELSTNFGELDLEALSRLDGRRWSSSCRSQDGLEIVPLNGERDEEGEGTPENIRSLSQKYRPMFFDELIGQNIVVPSLVNAVSRGRIAPVYLFQGPRGTGKTSTARIFAAALNCVSKDEMKPCGYCRECTDFVSGKSRDFYEVDSTNKKGIDRIRYLLKNLLVGSVPSGGTTQYKVFVIDECHLLPSKTWLTFLKFLEEPLQRVVFVFVTTDVDHVPRTIQSRCQKFMFNKIKEGDIVSRLRKISADENLDVEPDALDLIALNADGSLRDAETMLEQLSLLGKKITTALVNELVGVVSDEKLLELLELAMSSDTAETVKRARDLMDSGVEPMVLMSQLASLIMDLIAGTYKIGNRNLSEAELDRLKHALKLLSESERQLRVSSERSTWFTATLLQLGSVPSPGPTQSTSSRRQSSKTTTDEDPSSTSRDGILYKKPGSRFMLRHSTSPASLCENGNGNGSQQGELLSRVDNDVVRNMIITCRNSEKLGDIWAKCIERCHSKTLRQLLRVHGKLLSISEVEGVLIAYVSFGDQDIKSRAERFLSSITNAIEMVLRRNVEVRTILLPDGNPSSSLGNSYELSEALHPTETSATVAENNISNSENNNNTKEKAQEIPMQRIESIIREQRLETAWLQAVEKGIPGSLSHLRPEKNQVLPQENCIENGGVTSEFSSKKWEDELNHELKVLKLNDERLIQKEQNGKRSEHYPMSPSLLHDGSYMGNFAKDNLGYESGSATGGCSGLFCWNNTKPHKKGKGTPVRSRKSKRFSLFGDCTKVKKSESRLRR